MKLHMQISFDRMEQRVLEKMRPCIRIAFPTDRIDEARRTDESQVDSLKRQYEGRPLLMITAESSRKDRFTPEQIHAAWDKAVTLAAVLEAQSDRAYWERELRPRRKRTPAEQHGAQGNGTSGRDAVGLVAPGTDVCGMLAENRQAMHRDVLQAVALLAEAMAAVGPIPEDDDGY